MSDLSLNDELEELSSAEDFLQFFNIDYEPSVVHVNRLHIMQRFHDYLEQGGELIPEEDEARRAVYASLIRQSYEDFVKSDALTEKVFKVFRMHEPQQTFVPLDQLLK